MNKILLTLLALALITPGCKPGGWQFSVNKYDLRTATILAKGSTNGQAVDTGLSVICGPGPQGAVSIIYIVFATNTISDFDFNSFEGPYAPALSKKLVDIDIVTSAGSQKTKIAVSGSYIENYAFTFSTSAMNTGRSHVRAIAEALVKGADTIRITVHDMNDLAKQIRTDFPALNAPPVIEKTITGCCKD